MQRRPEATEEAKGCLQGLGIGLGVVVGIFVIAALGAYAAHWLIGLFSS